MRKFLVKFYWEVLRLIPWSFARTVFYTRGTQTPVKFKHFLWQRILGVNRDSYFPVHFTSIVQHPKNIYAGIDVSPGFSIGCYISGIGKIYIGDYTQIGPHVGIISANHNVYNNSEHIIEEVKIGKYCWIGMGAKILPGVILGDFTIVAAGSVVTKSFLDGYCVIGGVPAKKIRDLDRSKCIPFKNKYEYNGFIVSTDFKKFRQEKLNL